MQYEVVCNFTLMCCFAVQTNNTLQWRWLTGLRYVAWLRFVVWMNVWNGCCRVGLWRAARTFACSAACVSEFEVRAKYWRSMQYEVVCNFTLMCYFAVQTNNNTLQWRWLTGMRYVAWLTFIGWMNVWNGCCRVGLWRIVRTFACIATCVLEF